MILFSRTMSMGNYYIIQVISMITMVVSYLVPIILYIQQKGQHRSKIKKHNQLYMKYLDEQRESLQLMKNNLILYLHTNHPETNFGTKWAKERSSAIWSRIPSDSDYLKLRTGLGTIPSGFSITVPKQDAMEKDPLIDKAQDMADKFISIANVPVLLDLKKYRVVGVVGDEEYTRGFTRSLITQLATHHSPDEVKVASFFSKQGAADWDWLRWLPHAWDDQRKCRFIFEENRYKAQVLDHLNSIFQRRQWVGQSAQGDEAQLPNFVFIIPELQLLEHDPILPLLLNEAEKINVSSIVMASSREKLPKECQLVIEVTANGATMRSTTVTAGDRTENTVVMNNSFLPDAITLDATNQFARAMAPYQLKKAAADEIPGVLTLFQLFGIQRVEELDVSNRWSVTRFPDTLPVSVGVKGGGKPVLLNLHDKIERKGHGPHGLMAGTTGSGKSEVIQSLIAALAAQYHPHDLAFMLIDYKGGGMSNTFANLPHVIATITNLEEEGLIDRSKVSLKAELERRQKLFAAAGNVQHIDEYYSTEWRTRFPLPHLVIVIDEFAQLKKDQPEFMSELVSIAAIGRTLGVHLLLATQKPGGVVDDKIWSNSRYRVCLRVQDEGDSREMLKIPDAAYITNPGRGYLQVGSNEVFESVQFAWSGAPYRPDASTQVTDENIYSIELDGSRQKLSSAVIDAGSPAEQSSKSAVRKQLDVLIEWTAQQFAREGLSRLPGPWLAPLPSHLSLDRLDEAGEEQEGALCPVVGLVDDVANQSQQPLTIDIESGNWIVYGMPGTGKTTFIQTLLFSIVQWNSPDDVNIYVLDFSRMLKDFVLLPQVGDVLQEEDEEKFGRLFSYLDEELGRRKQLFAERGVKSRRAYCEETGEVLPAIVIAVDGYVSFKTRYESAHERFETVIREGASLGMYVVMTANRISEITERVRSNFPNAVSYLMADTSDYYYAVGRVVKPPSSLPEGRGYVKGKVPPLSFQTALPLEAVNDSARSKLLLERFAHIDQLWIGNKPSRIATLPAVISKQLVNENVEDQSDGKLALGLHVASLKPFMFSLEDGPYFLIAGRMESGKTALVTAIALELTDKLSPNRLHMYVSDFRRSSPGLSSLKDLGHMKGFATSEKDLEDMLLEIRRELERRSVESFDADKDPQLVLLIDDAEITAKRISSVMQITQTLEYIVQTARDNGLIIFVAGQAGELQQNWDAWLKGIKSSQTGILLGTTDMSDLQLFNIKVPFEMSGKMLPSGEGLFIRRKYERVKVVYPFVHGVEEVVNQVKKSNEKWFDSII